VIKDVIYRCVVGAREHGLDGPGSDTDRRGIYLPPATGGSPPTQEVAGLMIRSAIGLRRYYFERALVGGRDFKDAIAARASALTGSAGSRAISFSLATAALRTASDAAFEASPLNPCAT